MVKHVHWYYTVIGSLVVVAILVFSMKDSTYRWRQESGLDMVQDVRALEEIFNRIDATCHITDFTSAKQDINFLNVKSFAGSEIGSMNVAHPQGWQGPYVEHNPTVQGHEYQIVKGSQGYFIVPGDGVKLPGGKVMGKDLILDTAADIAALIKTDLQFHDEPLARPVPMGKHMDALSVEAELSQEE